MTFNSIKGHDRKKKHKVKILCVLKIKQKKTKNSFDTV